MKLTSTPQTFLLFGSIVAKFVVPSAADVASFVDDIGTTHEIASDATIVTGAMDAVAFSHFGLPSDRIIATFANDPRADPTMVEPTSMGILFMAIP
jgi:hypothetical protein